MSTTNALLIAAGAVVAAFVVALGGAYYAMPAVAPGVVARADSLTAAADSSSAALAAHAPDSTRPLGPEAKPEPISEQPDSAATGSSVMTGAPQPLRDSLEAVRGRLSAAREETATQREEVQALRRELSVAEEGRLQAGELGKALLDMEQRELQDLLKDVDMEALKRLYENASGRARTHLLKSMDPARAARFVNEVVKANGAAASSSSASVAPRPRPASSSR